jgi:hypothetical protein
MLLRNHRPLYFFALIALSLLAVDLVYGILWIAEVLPPLPNWIHVLVMTAVFLLSGSLVLVGVVMNAINAGFRELASLQRRSR